MHCKKYSVHDIYRRSYFLSQKEQLIFYVILFNLESQALKKSK